MEITEEMINESIRKILSNDNDSMAAAITQSASMPASRPWNKEAKMKHVYNPISHKMEFKLVIE